jgi:cell division protein FtsA
MEKTLLNKEWAAIDIGTTKICVLIAKLNEKGDIEILGIGHNPSHGLKKGVVVDINSTVESIKSAVASAEKMAGTKINNAIVGISGGHVQSFNSQGVVAIRHGEVGQEDIDRVIESAKTIHIPKDREILHILPQYFKVDGQQFIKDSSGMSGVRLESQVHIITGSVSSASNIIKCCEDAGIIVSDIVLETLASAEAVLSKEERELGVGVVDIGGGTSDFAIYKDGRILHSKVLPVAGNLFTRDLAIGLKISLDRAEDIKRKYGFVSSKQPFTSSQDFSNIDLGYGNDGQALDPYALYEVLQPRAQEAFEFIVDDVIDFNLRPFMPFGLVLTGGGSLLGGIKELASEVFGMPTRLGRPQNNLNSQGESFVPDVLKSPVYSTGYGLLIYASRGKDLTLAQSSSGPLVSRVCKRMKSWLYDFF